MVDLFVYGIFLDEIHRHSFQMQDNGYVVTPYWKTVGGHIVQAVFDPMATLTGLWVSMPVERLAELDRLEGGYERIKVQTSAGELSMYAKPGERSKLDQFVMSYEGYNQDDQEG